MRNSKTIKINLFFVSFFFQISRMSQNITQSMEEKTQTEKNPLKEPVKHLIKKYYASDDIHLNPSTTNILKEIKSDPNLDGLTAEDVISFKNSLYHISVS